MTTKDIHVLNTSITKLLLVVSGALDSIHPSLQSHQKRTCLIASRLAQELKISDEEYKKVFYAALIHDFGALGLKERIDLLEFEEANYELHANMGAALLKESKILENISDIVKYHHHPYIVINHNANRNISFLAPLIHLSDRIEVLCHQQNLLAHAPTIINQIRGSTLFHPQHVEAFLKISKKDAFWFELGSSNIDDNLLEIAPKDIIAIDSSEAEGIGQFISLIIDTRSRFTARHSSGVATCAATIAELSGLSQQSIENIKMAGHLHDIGKLSIPTELLEKPGALTIEERALIKSHVYRTYEILKNIEGLEEVTEIAVMHHERNNGEGYPFGKNSSELNPAQKIMAVADVFTALAENRPYRQGLSQHEVLEIMGKEVAKDTLDKKYFDLLKDNYAYIFERVSKVQDLSEAKLRRFWEISNQP